MPDTGPSPLVEVEQRVLARAKQDALDLDDAGAERALAALVDDEIAAWNDDHRRGLRSHPLPDPELVAERAMRNLVGYGPLGPLLG